MKLTNHNVTLVAHTVLAPHPIDHDTVTAVEDWMELDPYATDAESLIEFAGRNCYQSFGKPNPATEENVDYLTSTIFEKAHGSIAEHASATVYLTGVSRAFLTELTRHRHLSFSVLSQRFVNESESQRVLPPAILDYISLRENGVDLLEVLGKAEDAIGEAYDEISTRLQEDFLEQGLDKFPARKQANEAARAILPNYTETRMVVTGNLRTWHEVLERRTAPDADAEMQQVCNDIWYVLNQVSPTLFPVDELGGVDGDEDEDVYAVYAEDAEDTEPKVDGILSI